MDDLFGQDLNVLTVVGVLIAQDADRAKPATAETNDLVAFAQGTNGDRADRGIQPRHVPAAGENTDHALLGVDVRHIGLNPAWFNVSFVSNHCKVIWAAL